MRCTVIVNPSGSVELQVWYQPWNLAPLKVYSFADWFHFLGHFGTFLPLVPEMRVRCA